MKFKLHLLIVLSIAFFLSSPIIGQHKAKCDLDQRMQIIFEQQPNYELELEKGFKDFNSRKYQNVQRRVPIVIPVHVIIVHAPGTPVGSGNNFTFDHVMSQITVLNEDYGRYNSDAVNTPPVFPAADTDIQFCLATVDPDGNGTDGITRYPTNLDFDANEATIKAATGWDRDYYLNIWVAPIGGGVLGYAYLPTTTSLPNPVLDGVVIGSPYFGGPGYAGGGAYSLGRTATHEVGHFLGLRHIWRNNGCTQDDGIADTPLQDDENYGCPNHPSPSCSNNGDMFMNYMDYTDDDCMNAFSAGQGDYMQLILGTSRSSLAGSSFTACSEAVAPLALELVNASDALCFGSNDGTIEVLASGGTPTYTYTLSTGASNSSGLFFGLYAGTYTVEATDNGGQSISFDVTIGEPAPIDIQVSDQQNNPCASSNAGSISVYATGGTSASGNYLYSINQGPTQTTGTFSNLPSGTYFIEVFDDNTCFSSVEVQISSPPAIVVSIGSQINVSCNGGSNGVVSLSASGGVPNFTYTLGSTTQANGTFTNLAAGPYTVTVTDQNGCTKTSAFTITQPAALTLNPSTQTNIACNGDSTGVISLVGSGGTPAYLYSSNGTTYNGQTTYTGLPAGTYIMHIKDSNQCIAQDTFVLSQNPDLLLSITAQTNVQCFGDQNGSLTVSASGGLPAYLYMLGSTSNSSGVFNGLTSGTYSVMVIDAANCVETIQATLTESSGLIVQVANVQNVSCNGGNNGQITVSGQGGTGSYTYSIDGVNYQSASTFPNLPAGQYTVIMNDGNNCMTTVNATVTQPAAMNTTASIVNVSCNGLANGAFMVVITGGTAPYTALMNGNGVSVQNNVIQVTGLSAGSYEISITDNFGCPSATTLNINEPEILTGQITQLVEQPCDGTSGGEVSLTAEGGTPGYTYTLNGQTNSTGLFTGLNAGVYAARIKDANNCIYNFNVSIPLEGGLTLNSISSQNVSCKGENDGILVVDANGGNGDLVYSIGNTTNTTGIFEGLAPGNYNVSVSDPLTGCTIVSQVTIEEPEALDIQITGTTVGSTVGVNTTTLAVTGGTGPFVIAVGDRTNIINDTIVRDLQPDNYTIWVTDSRGCEDSTTLIITSAKDLTHFEHVLVSPNPFDNQINVKIDTDEAISVEFVIVDISGRLIYRETGIKLSSGRNNHTIFTNNLVNSIYILKIVSNSKLYIEKIFKD